MSEIPLQETSLEIWDTKYRLKDLNGEPVDRDINDTRDRVAKALAEIEVKHALSDFSEGHWGDKFKWALANGAIPAGRIISNIGAEKYKPSTSTINCTVSGTIDDSMRDILDKVVEAGLTLTAGCGIGYDFSTLRPKGAFVQGVGAYTSGPISFMDIYDKMCQTIESAGSRRGAQMATFNIAHPDVEEFIRAKRENGRLRMFNLSLLITDEFMAAVKGDLDWDLYFPISKSHKVTDAIKVVYKPWPVTKDYTEGYTKDGDGLVACKVYKTIKAKKLWNLIMTSTYDFAEPGFILIDKVNDMNNNWFCEEIRATNPCGEQPLPPYGSCLLGSINLTLFVSHPFTDRASFVFVKFRKVVAIFTRMLDNVVEINGLALPEQRAEIKRKRRHGMGYLGLGSTLALMGIRYGSSDSTLFTYKVTKTLAMVGWETSLVLAKEKGPAPIMDEMFTLNAEDFRKRPELAEDGYKIGDEVPGRVLLFKYSRYMQKMAKSNPELIKELIEHGGRFTHHSSIAPTGTISLSLANNASNGIEPSFAHHYSRNVIKTGKKTKEKMDVYSYELLAYRHHINPEAMPEDLPDYFISADEVTPRQHVDIQAAAQEWIDSSISKTINVPTDIPFEDFKDIYQYAYDSGLKGCTTFRFNPEAFQGVLVKEEDLENTQYKFTLENGEVIILRGNEEISYDGDTHTAANLYDALKEGYYGKY
ncbi:MAG: adenosylcobalamin-dependent ribonucleoside-diphosphate reductase [Nitrosopumilus sp.]